MRPPAPAQLSVSGPALKSAVGLAVAVRANGTDADPGPFASRAAAALRNSGLFADVQYPAGDAELVLDVHARGSDEPEGLGSEIMKGVASLLTVSLLAPVLRTWHVSTAAADVIVRDRSGRELARYHLESRAKATHHAYSDAWTRAPAARLAAADHLLKSLIERLDADRPKFAAYEKRAVPARGHSVAWKDDAPPEATALALFEPARAAAPAPAPASASPSPAPASPAASDVDAPGYSSAPRPDDFAVVVGIEDYPNLPKAKHAQRDAQAVRAHMKALGVPERNVVSLTGASATRGKLAAYLDEWLPKNVKPSSRVFFYYSGHGAPDPKSGQAYLVPADGDPMFLQSTAYPLKELYAKLAKLPAKQVVVALDACFSGAGGRSVLAQGARPLVTKTADLAPSGKLSVLAAASGDEITGALDEQGHGMFTYFLLKGLSTGKRSTKDLHDFIKPQVQDEARRQNREQTPALLGQNLTL